MATPVEVPKLGNSVEECVIGRWMKRVGDPVASGEVVAEIETDKTTFEVTAPVGGKLLATFFEEGAVVPVFTNFFVVGDAGENAEAFRPQSAGAPTGAAGPAGDAASVATASGDMREVGPSENSGGAAAARVGDAAGAVTATSNPREFGSGGSAVDSGAAGAKPWIPDAARPGDAAGVVTPTGNPREFGSGGNAAPAGAIRPQAAGAVTAIRNPREFGSGGNAVASGATPAGAFPPLAAGAVTTTSNTREFGSGGNVVDSGASRPQTPGAGTVAATAERATSGPARLSPRARRFAEVHNFHPAAVSGSGPGGRILEEDLRKLYETRPKSAPRSRLRETIARRMRESLATTAQYTMNASADAAGLLMLRARIKASVGAADININHLVTYCTIRALREVPSLNAEFVDGKIQEHAEVHLGFACDTPKGLMVPVVRDAHALSLAELAARMKELTARATAGTIAADDLSGATFTISNLGNLGIEWFTPLLNPPQVAILGVNAIQLKPVRKDGRVEFIDAIGFSLTCDHQAIDGAPGARFLQVLKAKIEGVEAECQNRF